MPHRDYEDLAVMQEWWDGREAGFQVRWVFCLLREGAIRKLSINLSKMLGPPVEVLVLLLTRSKEDQRHQAPTLFGRDAL